MPVEITRITLLFAIALTLVATVSDANAAVVASHSFEGNSGLPAGQNGGVLPSDQDFTGTFGSQTNANHLGILNDSALARTGNNAYYGDLGSNVDFGGSNPDGFGGNFSGIRYDQPAGTFTENTTFNVSAFFAENPTDLITGGSANLHLEFYDAGGALIFRNDFFGLETVFTGGFDNGDATPDYTQIIHNYQLGEAITNGRLDNAGNTISLATLGTIASARALISGNNNGNSGGGQFFVDDLSFSASTPAAVPEPGSFVFCTLLMGSLLLRRRR